MTTTTTPQDVAGSCSASSATPTALSTQKASAIQFADGRIDDGSVHEAPHVYLGDDALTSAQARELAAALIETADEVDRWAQR